jgi:phosphoglycerate dehydrogenase-like enzyme
MHIVVLDDYENNLSFLKVNQVITEKATIDIHQKHLTGDALLNVLTGADVVVLNRDRTPLRKPLIDQLPKLKYVVFTGNRNLAIDYDELAKRQIPVSYTEMGPSKETTVELTWALILSAYKRIHEQSALIQTGQWRNQYSVLPALIGERLGVLGLGNIGAKVAKVGLAFGMDVVTWSPRMTSERAAEHGVTSVSMEELLSTSKIVSLHLVPGETTRNIMNAERLALMRPDSLLVNTSRSTLINTEELLVALKKGQPGMAALDVFDEEPIPLSSPLNGVPNLLMTPHLGFVSQPIFQTMAKGVQEVLEAWVKEENLVNIFNSSK